MYFAPAYTYCPDNATTVVSTESVLIYGIQISVYADGGRTPILNFQSGDGSKTYFSIRISAQAVPSTIGVYKAINIPWIADQGLRVVVPDHGSDFTSATIFHSSGGA